MKISASDITKKEYARNLRKPVSGGGMMIVEYGGRKWSHHQIYSLITRLVDDGVFVEFSRGFTAGYDYYNDTPKSPERSEVITCSIRSIDVSVGEGKTAWIALCNAVAMLTKNAVREEC